MLVDARDRGRGGGLRDVDGRAGGLGDVQGDGGGAEGAADEGGDALEGEDGDVVVGEGFVLEENWSVRGRYGAGGGRRTSLQVPERSVRDLDDGAAMAEALKDHK